MKISTIFNEVLKEELELKELYGISFDARVWAPIIKNHIQLGNRSKGFIINGKEYPQQYKTFPVDKFLVDVRPEYGSGGGYDENVSGYDKDKNYVIKFIFGRKPSLSTIHHELRHAYEDFMRMTKGKPGTKDNKEAYNLFSGDFENFMVGVKKYTYEPFFSIIAGLYYTSKIERSAYADTVYDGEEIPVINILKELIDKTNPESIKNRFNENTLNSKWMELKSDYKIPILQKFIKYEDFIKWSSDEIKYKGNKSIKKLLKVKYHREQNKEKGG